MATQFKTPENMGDVRDLLQGKDIPAPDNNVLKSVLNVKSREWVMEKLKALYTGGEEEARAARETLNQLFGGHGTGEYALQDEPPKDRKSDGNSKAEGNNRRSPYEYGLKAKVHGGKGALSFEEDVRRDGIPTVRMEAAKALEEKKYDWDNKIMIQMTPSTLAVCTAVFLGLRGACEYSNYGDNNDKGFRIERQEGKFFVRVKSGEKGLVAVPIPLEDAFHVGRVLMAQLKKSMPNDGLSGGELITLLKATSAQAT